MTEFVRITLVWLTVLCGWSGAAVRAQPELTTVRVTSGLLRPLFVTHVPGDVNRLFVLEQNGKIRIIKDGVLLPGSFLNVDSLSSCCNERGLLGLAFHPDYSENGFFYINYTDNDGHTVVARYSVSGNPDVADPDTELILLTIEHPFANHNGGWLAFGPDGYLYVATGDGGFRDDPGNRAQTITGQLLGKMLRLDVNGDDFPNDLLRNYAVPPDNPFVGVTGDDEIWAYGLRNPWRNAFDALTGDLYIADVGQDYWEEINFQPAVSEGGENYGWRCMEGLHCSELGGCDCFDPDHTLPVHEYIQDVPDQCSITGGEVYRGCLIPDLQGTYFFADYCSDEIFSLRYAGGNVSDLQDRTAELAPGGGLGLFTITSFGKDAYGEIYICDHSGGEVFKIVPRRPLITGSDPSTGAIDARQPPLKSQSPSDWQSIMLTLAWPVGCVTATDFHVSVVGSVTPAPQISHVERIDATTVVVHLDAPPPHVTRMSLRHVPTGWSASVGVLPGDVNASGTTTSADIIDWIDTLNGVGAGRPIWSVDIDRSGAVDASDLATLLDLLDDAGDFESFNGRSLP